MICDRVAPYLSAYAAGELAPPTDAWVRAHLKGCGACESDAARLGAATASLRRVQPDAIEPPRGFSDAVMATVERDRSRRLVGLPLLPASELARASGDIVRVVSDNRDTIVVVASTAAAVAGALWLARRAARSLRPGPARA